MEKIARNHPGSKWYEVEFEANKAMCKELGIKVLPWIQFVLDGEVVESFSCGCVRVCVRERERPRSHTALRVRAAGSLCCCCARVHAQRRRAAPGWCAPR